MLHLLPLLLACADSGGDTGFDGELSFSEEQDGRNGRFHLAFEMEPDPPVLGPATFTVEVTILNSNPDLDGARMVAGSVDVEGWSDDAGLGLSGVIEAEEDGTSGRYVASWTWPAAGVWALTVTADSGSEDDWARVGYVVGQGD